MKFSYKFSNLLGTIYRKGNVCFYPDGNSIISPVGNKVTAYDLKNNKAKTLSLESRYNYTTIALSPDGTVLIAVNETGEAQMISMLSCTVVQTHKFRTGVQCVTFSPDGKYFAVGMDNIVLVFKAPGEITGEYKPFVLERSFYGAHDDIVWIDWSTDSRFLAIGSKANITRIASIKYCDNFRSYMLGGHTDSIVGCFFEADSLDINTLSKNGQLCLWECSLEPTQINEKSRVENEEEPVIAKKSKGDSSESEDDIDNAQENEETEEKCPEREDLDEAGHEATAHPFTYKKLGRHYLADEPRKEHRNAYVASANYHQKTKILVVCFSTGSFYLYELPDVNMIHSLSISDYAITSACFNPTGDWICLASSGLGQLLVWEWQSEQYIMKQQGHSSEMTCISYSPDGQYIASGGEDAKVKLWNVSNGFCFVTFSEHTSSVTAVQFSSNKKFLISSSLDGTVRAYDIVRYRNFRTLTSPRPVQFSCVAVDHSGELVAAGGQDVFEIYLWSMKFGKLLEILSGHDGPVTSITFSPIPTSSTLVSGSWDKTIKIWKCIEASGERETIDLLSDVSCVAFKPDGEEIAVSTISGTITFFDLKTSNQIGSIEGRNDLGSGVSDVDVITAKKNLQAKFFSTIEYSADGECILAAGKSYNVCIFHVREGILLKKFEITQNHSLDGMDDFINRRKMTEFGNMALVEERDQLEGGNIALRLPGVQKGDMAARSFKPEVRVFSVRFSPTGQAWAAASTEGLLIYSLDRGVVFDPFNLSLEVTPKATRECLKNKEYSNALIMALKLNEPELVQEVFESIPHIDIELVSANLPNEFAQRALQHIVKLLEMTPHVEFYLKWSNCLLSNHGNKDGVFQPQTLLSMHESMSRKYDMLSKICDFNKYTLRVLIKLSAGLSLENKEKETSDSEEEMTLVKHRDIELTSEFYDTSSGESENEL